MKKITLASLLLLLSPTVLATQTVFATENSEIQVQETQEVEPEALDIQLQAPSVTIGMGGEFDPSLYATATINGQAVAFGEAGTAFSVVLNDVDTTTPGEYSVVYHLVDSVSGAYIEKELKVIVIKDEVINNNTLDLILSRESVSLLVGEEFDPSLYATATINGEPVMLGKENDEFFISMNDVDMSTPGVYHVTYRLVDLSANAKFSLANTVASNVVEKTLTVNVLPIKEILPTILAEDQTLYVGDVLTEDIIFSWATFNNVADHLLGFEVSGDSLDVDLSTDKLLHAGVHNISYFVLDEAGTTLAEKTIKLTVLDKQDKQEDKAIKDIKQIKSGSKEEKTDKKLPETGEKLSGSMFGLGLGAVLLSSLLFFFRKKRKA